MRGLMIRAGAALVALFLLALAAPAARADTLMVKNATNHTITITLDGGIPFVETLSVQPGETRPANVWRVAAQRHITVVDEDTGDTYEKDMRIDFGRKLLTVQRSPAGAWSLKLK